MFHGKCVAYYQQNLKKKGNCLCLLALHYTTITLYNWLIKYRLSSNVGNDLECGCEMAWIIDHEARDLLQKGTCDDGRLVSGLTRADFVDC